MDMSLSELWELVMDREAWPAAAHGVTKSWTRLSDWTELPILKFIWEGKNNYNIQKYFDGEEEEENDNKFKKSYYLTKDFFNSIKLQ